jgi:hypothetical protein
MSLASGYYQFTTTTDDGVRLLVDGNLVIDKWIDQGPTSYSVTLPMDAAPHTIAVEYYENGGGATAKFAVTRVGDLPPTPAWHAEYWNNPDGGSAPAIPARTADVVRDDPTVAFEWYDGSPAVEITPNTFIARWTRTDVLSAGTYRFSGAADDGIRVFVDNVPIIDMWQLQNASFSVDTVIGAGEHQIRIEYFENSSGARALVDYQRLTEAIGGPPPSGGDGYAAEHFRQPRPGRHCRAHPHGPHHRLRLGLGFAGHRSTGEPVLRPVDQIGDVHGRRVRVLSHRRRRGALVHRRRHGAGQVDPAGPDHVRGAEGAHRRNASDRDGVFRERRRRGREVLLCAVLGAGAAGTAGGGVVRRAVLRQHGLTARPCSPATTPRRPMGSSGHPGGVPRQFSARDQTLEYAAGTYRFTITAMTDPAVHRR